MLFWRSFALQYRQSQWLEIKESISCVEFFT
jgi:hypothetical protein